MSVQSDRKTRNGGWLHPIADPKPFADKPLRAHAKRSPGEVVAINRRAVASISPDLYDTLAHSLGVGVIPLEALHVGWFDRPTLRRLHAGGNGWRESYPDGAFSFPERDADGKMIGIALRALDGRKGCISKARRGLTFVPELLRRSTGLVFVVEGASDTAVGLQIGINVVGRPSNSGGGAMLTALLDGRRVIVVGENDRKPDGRWPGRDGAESVARELCLAGIDATVMMPPSAAKDLREWLK